MSYAPVLTEAQLARFWAKVDKSGRHWMWTASTRANGWYGQFRVGDHLADAHRISWVIHFGPIPTGMCVLHHCDISLCVYPDDLFLGTRAENLADMRAKGRDNWRPGLAKINSNRKDGA